MSQCFVLDTLPRGTEKKQFWEVAKKKGSTQDRVEPLAVRKRAISEIAGEMAIFHQLSLAMRPSSGLPGSRERRMP